MDSSWIKDNIIVIIRVIVGVGTDWIPIIVIGVIVTRTNSRSTSPIVIVIIQTNNSFLAWM